MNTLITWNPIREMEEAQIRFNRHHRIDHRRRGYPHVFAPDNRTIPSRRPHFFHTWRDPGPLRLYQAEYPFSPRSLIRKEENCSRDQNTDLMNFIFTKNIGMLLLDIYLIVIGLSTIAALAISGVITGERRWRQ